MHMYNVCNERYAYVVCNGSKDYDNDTEYQI